MRGFLQIGRERNQGVKRKSFRMMKRPVVETLRPVVGTSNKWAVRPCCLSTGVNEVSLKPATQ